MYNALFLALKIGFKHFNNGSTTLSLKKYINIFYIGLMSALRITYHAFNIDPWLIKDIDSIS